MNIEIIEKNIHKKIQYFEKIDSTHLYAKRNLNDEDVVIIADSQTGGIGTKGRKWCTGNSKNIAMTIVRHPECKVVDLDGITIKIAEQIKDIIKDLYNCELKIKEPNDLMLNNKKICGILTEIHTRGEKIEYMLISIGFNVNEEMFDKETKNIATSLKIEFNKEFDREPIIINIINKIDMIIEQN